MSFILNPLNSVVPIGGVSNLTGNSGGAVGPTAGNINVVGTGDVLVTGNPGTSTLTISVTGGIPETFDADSGSATSSGGIININGGTSIATSASGNTIDIAVTEVAVANGGTGATTLTGVLIGNGTSAVTGNAITQYDVLIGGASNAIVSVSPSTANYVLTSNGVSAAPSFKVIPAAFQWSVVTVSGTAAVNNGYICNKAGTLALLLPATASLGDMIRVTGINTATGWQITQNANQQIFFGASATTSGTGGSLESTAIRDSVELVCVVSGASTIWNVISSIGNITVT